MKRNHLTGAFGCLILTAAGSTAAAQGNWSLNRLNPLTRHSPPARAAITDQPPAASHSTRSSLPKFSPPQLHLHPQWPARRTRPAGAPSALSRLSDATRRFWEGTKRVLMPWRRTEPSSSLRTGARPSHSSSADARIASKKSFFSSLLHPNSPEKKKVKTVNDFLALPKPTF